MGDATKRSCTSQGMVPAITHMRRRSSSICILPIARITVPAIAHMEDGPAKVSKPTTSMAAISRETGTQRQHPVAGSRSDKATCKALSQFATAAVPAPISA